MSCHRVISDGRTLDDLDATRISRSLDVAAICIYMYILYIFIYVYNDILHYIIIYILFNTNMGLFKGNSASSQTSTPDSVSSGRISLKWVAALFS
jgi:hypothetical protein